MTIWILCDPAEIKRASLRLNSESDCYSPEEHVHMTLPSFVTPFVIRFPLAFERQPKLLFVTISHFKTAGAD